LSEFFDLKKFQIQNKISQKASANKTKNTSHQLHPESFLYRKSQDEHQKPI